jgi:hypothetical protein
MVWVGLIDNISQVQLMKKRNLPSTIDCCLLFEVFARVGRLNVLIDGGWRHCRRCPDGANWANVFRALDDNPSLTRIYELIGLVIRILLQRHVVDELSMDVYGD